MEITNDKSIAPEGYVPLNPQQRGEWNGFIDYANGQEAPVADLFDKYKAANPNISLDAAHVPAAQYEVNNIKNGSSFGDIDEGGLNNIRQGLGQSYLGSTDLNKSYYPTFKFGNQDFGTDLESYYKSRIGLTPTRETPEITANAPTTTAPLPINSALLKSVPSSVPENAIPRPNYNDSSSRLSYLQQWSKKYGSLEGRGDHILKLNEVPRTGSDTTENIAKKIGSKYGIDPALLNESAMEEGMSELYKDKSGLDTKRRKPTDFGYMGDYGNKEFPINGNNSMGLPDFAKRFPELVAGGYLPKSFRNKFQGTAESAENNFKTVEDAMEAKAALFKYGQDYVDKLAKKRGIPLSDTARQFFTLAFFNGGEGGVLNRLVPYAQKGLLKDDQFLNERPEMEKGKPDNLDVYGHVIRRIKMANALKREGYFNGTDN